MVKFLTPSEVPEEVVCRTIKVPNSLEWLGIFNAVLLAGTYYYNWSDDIDTHMTREEAAAAYTVIFNEYLTAAMDCDICTLPTGGSLVRQSGFGRFQMLDNGEWGEPTGDYALPPLNARTEPTNDEKRCLGAANAANVYQMLYEALADEYAENHDLALFFLAIGVSISLIFLPPLGLLAASFLEIATILVAEGFGAFAFLTADVWDSEFTDVFKCLLYENASVDGSGVVTFDFAQVVNDVANTMSLSFDDPTLQKARLALQLGTILQYTGADGLNYAASTTAITDADCDECGEWGVEWLLADEDAAFGTYSDDWGVHAIYTSGVGWEARVNADRGGGERATFFSIDRAMPDANYQHMEIDVDVVRGTYTVTPFTIFEVIFDGVVLLHLEPTESYSGTIVWDGNRNTTGAHLSFGLATQDVLGYTNGAGIPSGGGVTLTRIAACGTGSNSIDNGYECL